MIHFLPKSVLRALLTILRVLGVGDDLKIEVWCAIRAHEIAEEREWVASMCRDVHAWPARGGIA